METQVVDNIRKIRNEHGITQEEMANILDVTRATYNAIENGKRDLTVSELDKICQSIGITWNVVIDPDSARTNNEDKFERIYTYVLNNYFKDGIPKTKLAKIFYLIDFTNFYMTGHSMSGMTYIRRKYGPVSENFFGLTDDLYEEGKIELRPLDFAILIKPTPYIENDEFDLNEKERKLIDEICLYWKDKRTSEIVNFTHSQKPWQSCRDGGEIPYISIIQEDPNHVYAPNTDLY